MTKNDALTVAVSRAKATPQNQKADSQQVQNNAGGYVFQVEGLERFTRFLVTGVDSGTYYASAPALAASNAAFVHDFVQRAPEAAINEIVAVSTDGRAPKQQPGLFALAVATAADEVETRRAAWAALPIVARTGSSLKTFVKYRRLFGSLQNRLAERAIGSWFNAPVDQVAYQMAKYRNRDGWTDPDIFKMAHFRPADAQHEQLIRWMSGYDPSWDGGGIKIVEGYIKAKSAPVDRVAAIVKEYGLTHEMLSDEAKGRADVWEAMLDNGMPQTALIRNLPKLTNLGLLAQTGSRWTAVVEQQIADAERLKRARVHPMAVLLAHKTYADGHGDRGKSTWTPVQRIVDALDSAFYASYGAVERTGKKMLIALDVSGSMSYESLPNSSLTAREASAAMSLVTANVEPEHRIVGFTSANRGYRYRSISSRAALEYDGGLSDIPISPRQRLRDAVRAVSDLPFGGTDVSLPFTWAMSQNLVFDTVVVYTDNETWAGGVHVHQAINEYRRRVNPETRVVVAGMTATECTILDPKDIKSLNVAGFDAAAPRVLSDFAMGRI